MKACLLNAGGGSWAFEEHAQRLCCRAARLTCGQSFIPLQAMALASDKRRLARVFAEHQVPTPQTYLLESDAEIRQIIEVQPQKEWVLKWPTGCGGAGHRLQSKGPPIPADWPRPLVLQEFLRLEVPEVYRFYGVAGELFGWNVR